MKNIFQNIKQFISSHKWQTGVCASVLVLAVGAAGFGVAAQSQRVANTQKALEIAERDGIISTETLEALEENGGFAAMGTEITDPVTGETVVLTQNTDGTITKTVTVDASGNATGAIIPEDHSGDTGGGGGIIPTPTPVHSHTFIPHYATRTVQTGSRYVVDVPAQAEVTERVCVKPGGIYCNQCNAYLSTVDEQIEHTHSTGHGGSHTESSQYDDIVVSPAVAEQGHYEAVYGEEQYIDYYYCSDCGEHQ